MKQPSQPAALSVLVVEDSSCERLMIESLVRQLGFAVSSCDNAQQALVKLQQTSVDIMISDWRMPGMSGIALCQRVKGLSQPPFIILLTGKNRTEHMIQGIEAGADDFIAKPFQASVLKVRLLAAKRLVSLQRSLAVQNHKLHRSMQIQERYLGQLKEDLTSAAQLQRALLPPQDQHLNLWQISSHFQPATSLAGDIFQCFAIDESHLGFYLLDVAGHGIAASMQGFTLAQQLSRQRADWEALDSARLVTRLNQLFDDPQQCGRFATLILGIVNCQSGELDLTNAGHPAPLLLDNRGSDTLDAEPQLPIGIDRHYQYRSSRYYLRPDQRLLLYSDGLFESRHPKFGEFGQARLKRLCHRASGLSAEALIRHLTHKAKLWQQSNPQDDTSLLLLTFHRRAVAPAALYTQGRKSA